MRLLNLVVLLAAIIGLCAPSAEGDTIISYTADGPCSGSVNTATYSTTCATSAGATIGVSAEGSLSALRLSLDTAGPSGASATVRVTDTFTAVGGTGSGTLVFTWAIDGSLAADDVFLTELYINQFGGGAFADYRACGQNVVGASSICFFPLSANFTVNDSVTVNVPVTFGSAATLDWRLNALISACAFLGGPPFCNGATGTNAVHFFNTAQLQPLVVLDSNGNRVSGASVLSDSGFGYAIAPATATVPEPASHLLVGIVLVGLVVARTALESRLKGQTNTSGLSGDGAPVSYPTLTGNAQTGDVPSLPQGRKSALF